MTLGLADSHVEAAVLFDVIAMKLSRMLTLRGRTRSSRNCGAPASGGSIGVGREYFMADFQIKYHQKEKSERDGISCIPQK
jgi:hypothetical protein